MEKKKGKSLCLSCAQQVSLPIEFAAWLTLSLNCSGVFSPMRVTRESLSELPTDANISFISFWLLFSFLCPYKLLFWVLLTQEVATEEATKCVVGPALASNMSLSWRTSPTQEVLELSPEVEVSPSSGIISAGVTTKPLTKSPTLQVLVSLFSNWALLQISLVKKEYPGISEKYLIQGVKIISPNVRESGFPNPGNFCLWNLESGKNLHLESGTRKNLHVESGIREKFACGIRNPGL